MNVRTSASVLVRRQWGVCIRETYTCWPFEPFSKLSVEWNLFMSIASVLQGVLACFLCVAAASMGTQLLAGPAGCQGEALWRECPEAPSRKSCQACVGTCTLRDFMYLPLVQSHEASMPILFVPKYAPVWGNGSISFISVQSCSSPRVEILGCSAVRLYSTSSPTTENRS